MKSVNSRSIYFAVGVSIFAAFTVGSEQTAAAVPKSKPGATQAKSPIKPKSKAVQGSKSEPKEVWDVNNDGVRAMEAKNFVKAESCFLQAIAMDPSYKYARFNLSMLYHNRSIEQFQNGDQTGAFNSIYKAYLVEPSSKDNLPSLLYMTKINEPGQPNKSTDSPESRERLANFWMASGEYLYALAEYERLEGATLSDDLKKKMFAAYKEAKADFPNLVILHENAYPRLADIVRVEKNKEALEPVKIDFWTRLDQLIIRRKYDNAVGELTKHLGSNPTDLRALNRRGQLYCYIEDFVKAEIDARKLIELDDKAIEGHELLSIVLQEKKNYEQALAEVNRAIELNPDADVVYLQRADIYSDQGKAEQQKADQEKAKALKASGKAYHIDGTPKGIDMEVYVGLMGSFICERVRKVKDAEEDAAIAKLPRRLYSPRAKFKVCRDGKVTDLKLSQSCGVDVIDQILVDALKGQKFLRLPPATEPTLVEFTFGYNLEEDAKPASAKTIPQASTAASPAASTSAAPKSP